MLSLKIKGVYIFGKKGGWGYTLDNSFFNWGRNFTICLPLIKIGKKINWSKEREETCNSIQVLKEYDLGKIFLKGGGGGYL